MSQEFDNNILDLVKQKGFYPYEYMSNFEKFKEQLPSKEKQIKISNKFEIKTMKDCIDLNLKCNILLLADAFGKFRNNGLNNYGLCSSHYFSAPSLSCDAMLNMTKVELELIPDPDMYIFFEKSTRSGVLIFLIDNIKYLKSYDPKQESKHIIYLDANNLYGYSMFKFLPTSASNG